MTKEEYKSKKTELESIVRNAQAKMRAIAEAYIQSNKPFELGQAVKKTIRGKEELGIVKGFRVGYSYDVVPMVAKMKKDGTASQHEMYVCSADDLTIHA